jgi:L-asparaginase
MRIACLLADASFAEAPGVRALLDDPGVDVIAAPGTLGAAAGLGDAFGWARLLGERLADVETTGAVAVLSADVLAEVAYLLELAIGGTKAIVATGAVRPPGHRVPDAAPNLSASLQLARHRALVGACAAVVMAGTVHAARDVTRVCSSSWDAFASPSLGSLGLVAADGPVALTRRPPRREHLPTPRIEPDVAHVAALLGTGGDAVDAATARGAKGLVVETFASGCVPPGLAAGLERALAAGIPVVAASRARGLPRDDAARGGLAWLRERGVLVAVGLSPEKARVRLALALGRDGADGVRDAFAAPTPSAARGPVRRARTPPSRP